MKILNKESSHISSSIKAPILPSIIPSNNPIPICTVRSFEATPKIFLDLDETLIHSNSNLDTYDFKNGSYKVIKRNGLNELFTFLLSSSFRVSIWSAGTEDYVNEILENINIVGLNFIDILNRNQCTPKEDYYLKNIKQRFKKAIYKKEIDLSKTLIIDNFALGCQKNYGNLIEVPDFYGEQDSILFDLINYLKWILNQNQDWRNIDKRNWLKQ